MSRLDYAKINRDIFKEFYLNIDSEKHSVAFAKKDCRTLDSYSNKEILIRIRKKMFANADFALKLHTDYLKPAAERNKWNKAERPDIASDWQSELILRDLTHTHTK